MKTRIAWICLRIVLAAGLFALLPRGGTAGGPIAPLRVTEYAQTITMPDGIHLAATVIRPDTAGQWPAILVRTPYGKYQHLSDARFWATHGYAVIVQDARGKFESEGEYLPFVNEFEDGTATLDWISSQPWCSGDVGMWGSSYLAFCQLVLASGGHSALKSIMPISGWLQDEDQITHGGAHHIMLSIPWIYHEESQTKRSIADVEFDELFEHLPLIDAFKSVGIDSKIWCNEFDFSHLDRFRAADISIPALHITGWNDFVHRAALNIYQQAVDARPELHRLIVGPWIHDQFYTSYTSAGDEDFGPESALGMERLRRLSLDWFDYTLKQQQNRFASGQPVRLFVMGANEWCEYDRWPPEDTRMMRLFLSSTAGANGLGGDGTLLETAPATSAFDKYRFDPYHPVPTYGGANFHFMMHLAGVKDQRKIEARHDVLVYTSAPLQKDLIIAGPLEAVLFIATEGRDTDFTAKLVEVRKDGYARIIEEGIIRASFRNGGAERELLEPNTTYRLTVSMGSTAIRIPAGHRLRLEVSSSNFPKYDRNPNTGEDPLQAEKLVPVTQKVFHGGANASFITLPVTGE